MLKRGIIFWVLLWAVVPAVGAQDIKSPWYFAYNVDTGSLASYNLAGQSNILIASGVTGRNVIGTRISSDEALLLLRVDEKFGLYDATPDKITRLLGEDGILQVPLAYTEGAAVMVNQYAGRPVYASLFYNGVLTPLPNRAFGVPSYARFSQDGRFFRYIGTDDRDHFVLWNYDVVVGEQSLGFDFGMDVPSLKADTYGEHWVQRTVLDDGKVNYHLISLNGQADDLGTVDESQGAGSFQLLGEDIIAFGADCEDDCPFEVRSAAGVQTFQGDTNIFRGLPIARVSDDGLLMLNQDDLFYRATGDAPPQFIGSFTRDQYHLFSSSFFAVSPDARWLMTVDDGAKPTKHNVHNLITGEIVATYNYNKVPYLDSVRFGDGVVILRLNDNSYDFLLYNPDGTYQITHQAASKEIRVYFELLPDQSALYRTARPYTGIYLHDFKAGTESPVLEGAWEYINLIQLR
jgi:hypothetical protein